MGRYVGKSELAHVQLVCNRCKRGGGMHIRRTTAGVIRLAIVIISKTAT